MGRTNYANRVPLADEPVGSSGHFPDNLLTGAPGQYVQLELTRFGGHLST
jgi:hypothetical protein